MNPVLRALLDHHDGVLSRTEVTEVLPQWTIDSACRRGLLRRVLPEVYVDPVLLTDKAATPVDEAHRRTGGDPFTGLDARRARRAVLAYVAGRGAFSHLTALELWGLRRQPQAEPLHLTVPAESKLVSRPGLIIHHVIGFTVAPPQVLTRAGTPMTRLERALVDSWPILTTGDRRAPMIHAVTGRRTTPERIAEALARVPKLPGRAALRELLGKLAAGCHSPLEIWGHDHVFTGRGMPPFQRQARISVGGRVCYLDVYAERERVGFELDGFTTHGDRRQGEIDLRRDSLLASVGIQVVRFSHRRLIHDTGRVRREILAILASRH